MIPMYVAPIGQFVTNGYRLGARGQRLTRPLTYELAAPGETGAEEDAETGTQPYPHRVLGQGKEHNPNGDAENEADSAGNRFARFAVLVPGHPATLPAIGAV